MKSYKRYSKMWVALLGAIGIGLVQSGAVTDEQAETIITCGISLLAAFGVYRVPNEPPVTPEARTPTP